MALPHDIRWGWDGFKADPHDSRNEQAARVFAFLLGLYPKLPELRSCARSNSYPGCNLVSQDVVTALLAEPGLQGEALAYVHGYFRRHVEDAHWWVEIAFGETPESGLRPGAEDRWVIDASRDQFRVDSVRYWGVQEPESYLYMRRLVADDPEYVANTWEEDERRFQRNLRRANDLVADLRRRR